MTKENKKAEKRENKKTEIIYPKDAEITKENAIIEMAKSLRELRNFTRSIQQTDYGRIRVASWTTGYEFRDLLNTVKGIAQTLGIKEKVKSLESAKKAKAKKLELDLSKTK